MRPLRYRVKGQLSGLSLAARPSPDADGIGRPGLTQRRPAARGERDRRPGAHRHRSRPARPARRVRRARAAARPARRQARRGRSSADARTARRRRSSVKVASASFANADAKGELSATWRTGPGNGFGARRPLSRASSSSTASSSTASPRTTARYLPLGLPRRRAQLRRRRGARGNDRERDLPRPRRSLGLPVPRPEGRRATASSASPPRSRT